MFLNKTSFANLTVICCLMLYYDYKINKCLKIMSHFRDPEKVAIRRFFKGNLHSGSASNNCCKSRCCQFKKKMVCILMII